MSYGYSNGPNMYAASSSSGNAHYNSGFHPYQQGRYDAPQPTQQHYRGGSGESAGSMAGVGARRMTQKQEAKRLQAEQWQREEERRQWQAAEEQRRWEATEAQRQYQAEHEYQAHQRQQQQHWEQQQQWAREEEDMRMRKNQEEAEDRQRQHLSQLQWERAEEERRVQRQRDEEDEQQRRRQQRLAEEEQHIQQEQKRHRQQEKDLLSPPSSPLRGHTDSQATVKASQDVQGSRFVTDTTSLHLQPISSGREVGRHSTAGSADCRATLYDDDYEESDQPSLLHDHSTSRGCLYRETVCEPLPKATCADCGEQMAFDDLVHHECLHNALQSPLLTKGPGSLSSRNNSPMPTPSISEKSRSPFFDRYDGHQLSDLSPALSSTGTHGARSSLLIGLGTFNGDEDSEQQARLERKKFIEAQRAAKQQAVKGHSPAVSPLLTTSFDAPPPPASLLSVSPTTNSSSLPSPSFSPSPLLEPRSTATAPHARSHRRALNSQSSNASSSASSKSSLSSSSSAFFKRTPGTLTPSSSNELVSSPVVNSQLASQLRAKHSPARRAPDLQDLEGLVREIENSSASPARSMTAPTSLPNPTTKPDRRQGRDVKRGETLEPPERHGVRSRRPSDAEAASSAKPSAPAIRRTRTSERAPTAKLCSVCLRAFERNQPMAKRDGKLFCIDDYAELYLEKCRKCRLTVRTVGVRSRDGALSGLFHRECFSCLQCDTSFDDGTFYVLDNAPYCGPHYHALNGTLCGACGTGIEGQCRQLTPAVSDLKDGERFHMHCLTCQFDDGKEFCKDLLNDYYVYDGKRLCQWHYEKVMTYNRQRSQRQQNDSRRDDGAVSAAAMRAARRTTYVHTVQAKKGRA